MRRLYCQQQRRVGGQYEGYSVRRLDSLLPKPPPDLSTDEATARWLAQPMPDALCNPSQLGFPRYNQRSFHWVRTIDGDAFSREANSRYGTGRVKSVEVANRVPSGRVLALRITGDRRSVKITRELEIRSVLEDCPSNFLCSTWTITEIV